jgi:hypothetical protein
MLEALQRLRELPASKIDESVLDSLQKALEANSPENSASGADLQERLLQLREELSAKRLDVESWTITGDDSDVVLRGMADCYKRGSKAMVKAVARRTDPRLHEWRKRCKDHWYHMRLLEGLWPAELHGRVLACSELCELLGDDRDLAVLAAWLSHHAESIAGLADNSTLRSLIRECRHDLQVRAFALGRYVFAEKPNWLRKRLCAYWQIWTNEEEPPSE